MSLTPRSYIQRHGSDFHVRCVDPRNPSGATLMFVTRGQVYLFFQYDAALRAGRLNEMMPVGYTHFRIAYQRDHPQSSARFIPVDEDDLGAPVPVTGSPPDPSEILGPEYSIFYPRTRRRGTNEMLNSTQRHILHHMMLGLMDDCRGLERMRNRRHDITPAIISEPRSTTRTTNLLLRYIRRRAAALAGDPTAPINSEIVEASQSVPAPQSTLSGDAGPG
ncbi:hypothetical protein V8B97DRAFT_1918909 [Scleroderma yunnanense]